MGRRIWAIWLLLSGAAFAQVEMQQSFTYVAPHFYFDALNFKSDDGKSRMDFYFQMPYDDIQFVKAGNEFLASYEISLQLIDDDGNRALEETWSERPVCQSFDETTSHTIYSSAEKQFIVRPGAYTLKITVTDSETQKSYAAQRGFRARNYADSLQSLSDIMLLKSSTFFNGKRTIIPNVDENVISQSDSFPIFYEVYFPKPEDSAFATTEISDKKNGTIYSVSRWITGKNRVERVVAEIPKDSIPMGLYKLSVTLFASAEKESPVVATASRFFTIHFPDLPLTITDLDKAADEMMYIANGSTIDSIKSAPDMFIKEKRFLDFWQKYNPNKSSKDLRVMDEYFNRVAYANEHFTHYFQGWKTDMGMIYIIFGPPSSVDRHPFEVDSKPYEVWDYYYRNRQIVFVDETGFGDYRLVTPLSDVYSPPYGPDYLGK
ncbi:MAG TPA: GWxTD domain-containing protein [Candidatus Acidoferrales bacterium]|nr:GWxTD domain-containing protein [Candidatus Acidoferrales bacterium]